METNIHKIFNRKVENNNVKMPSGTFPYTIDICDNFTVIDFINYITSERPYIDEWGYISIVHVRHKMPTVTTSPSFDNPFKFSCNMDNMYLPLCIDYRFGKIFGKYAAPYKDASLYFNDVVTEVIASGYQDRCDYLLKVVNNPQMIFRRK